MTLGISKPFISDNISFIKSASSSHSIFITDSLISTDVNVFIVLIQNLIPSSSKISLIKFVLIYIFIYFSDGSPKNPSLYRHLKDSVIVFFESIKVDMVNLIDYINDNTYKFDSN